MQASSLAAAVVAGVLPLIIASSASAISVTSYMSVRPGNPHNLTFAEPGDDAPRDSLIFEFNSGIFESDPRTFGVSVTLETGGRARSSGIGTGTITNLLDGPVSGLANFDFGHGVDALFDDEGQRAEGYAYAELSFGDFTVSDAGPLTEPFGPDCLAPCFTFKGDSNGTMPQFFTIGARESLPVKLSVEVGVAAVAPVPLPAALPLSSAALGALALAGRRRSARSETA